MENFTAKDAVCFFGHRDAGEDVISEDEVLSAANGLIREGYSVFLFGSRSAFDELCLCAVTRLKEKYPHIKRVYVRAEYPHIDQSYLEYLGRRYDETYFPEDILGAGRGVYIRRNRHMIEKSSVCVVYCRRDGGRGGGTSLALGYAERLGRRIINLADERCMTEQKGTRR